MILASMILGSALSTAAMGLQPQAETQAGLREPFADVTHTAAKPRLPGPYAAPLDPEPELVRDPFVPTRGQKLARRPAPPDDELRQPFVARRDLAPERAGAPVPVSAHERAAPLRDPFTRRR